MQPSRNQPCTCGSGLKFKNCCGQLPGGSAEARFPIPYAAHVLPYEACGLERFAPAPAGRILQLLRRGNLPQAGIIARQNSLQPASDPVFLNFHGWVASAIGMPGAAEVAFSRAAALAPEWQLPVGNLERVRRSRAAESAAGNGKPAAGRFLLIKAWGYGFWADISHVLGQLLIAELTRRVPIIHWGRNSLFWDGQSANAFEAFFEPVSALSIADLVRGDLSIWPPKWNRENLDAGENNKWQGSYSRVAGLYLLGRPESLLVSDFYTPIFDLLPWVPSSSPLHGRHAPELYSYLAHKYLRPRAEVLSQVNTFYDASLVGGEFIAVHMRGSDKAMELLNLEAVNREYREVIEQQRRRTGIRRIFLMTDDARLHERFLDWYGDDFVSTSCHRTQGTTGVHYQPGLNRRQIGQEVMADVYLAVRGRAFVGNGCSNPSLAASYLGPWQGEDLAMFGPRIDEVPNLLIHEW
jgi:protein O-GlcNAc transferase